MVLYDAIATAANFGMVIYFNQEFEEYVVYPKGGSPDDPEAYFTMDIEDAVTTARRMSEEMV